MSMFTRRSDLEKFLTVVSVGSIFGAALQMGITQPSLSRMIARLEKQAGGRLFVRTPKGVTPTEFGWSSAKMAEVVLRAMSQADAEVAGSRSRATLTRQDLARAVKQSESAFDARGARHRWQGLDRPEMLSLLCAELPSLYVIRDKGGEFESAGALRRVAALALYGIASEKDT